MPPDLPLELPLDLAFEPLPDLPLLLYPLSMPREERILLFEDEVFELGLLGEREEVFDELLLLDDFLEELLRWLPWWWW